MQCFESSPSGKLALPVNAFTSKATCKSASLSLEESCAYGEAASVFGLLFNEATLTAIFERARQISSSIVSLSDQYYMTTKAKLVAG
jgi:hypothetical protein